MSPSIIFNEFLTATTSGAHSSLDVSIPVHMLGRRVQPQNMKAATGNGHGPDDQT